MSSTDNNVNVRASTAHEYSDDDIVLIEACPQPPKKKAKPSSSVKRQLILKYIL